MLGSFGEMNSGIMEMIKMYCNSHNGPKLVIKKEGLEIYGASLSEAENSYRDFDLIISLTKGFFKPVVEDVKICSKGLVELIKWYKPEILSLNWTDMNIPDLDKEFWIRLVHILKKKGRDRNRSSKGNNSYKVMVHCIGGHGRTGTALCILGNMIDKENWSGDLVSKVKERHCEKAVEVLKQVKYIELITGEPQNIKKFKKKESIIYSSTSSSSSSIGKSSYNLAKQCKFCKIIYSEVKEAIDCENLHIKDKINEAQGKLSEVPKLIKGMNDKLKEDLKKEKEDKDSYFEKRKGWRKDYIS